MKRWWLGFGDLRIGDRFRFSFGGPGAPYSRMSDVMMKISPRKYRDGVGSTWTTGANTAVRIEPIDPS
jgi:hypothetical protein